MAGGESVGFIDLDAVLAPDIKVKLNDAEWKLPGDAPTELLLGIILLSEQAQKAIEDDDTEKMLDLRAEISDRVEELFAMRQEVPEGFGASLADAQIGELVQKLFAHYYADDEDDPEAGGGRPTGASEPASTPPRSRRPSRSRRTTPAGKKTAPASSAS